mgnify:CR=1 FL=1|jgi:hypothetical protein
MEEMIRLKDVSSVVGLPIILKIGGVEAVKDVYNGLSLGVKGLIAPMDNLMSASDNQLDFIFCSYGYGSINNTESIKVV